MMYTHGNDFLLILTYYIGYLYMKVEECIYKINHSREDKLDYVVVAW